MGLGPVFLSDLIELKRSGVLDRATRVVEIGAQQLADALLQSVEALDELFRLFGRPRPEFGSSTTDASTFERLAPASRGFWQALGFDYAAIDLDGYRDCTALDLNRDQVPGELRGAFDLVVNTGTTEHVINQDNAFRVIHDLCRPAGVMYHELPAGGLSDHGLLVYTPKFFWRLASFNDYKVLSLKTCSWSATPVPQDIRETNVRFGGGVDHIAVDTVTEFSIRASLRKRKDAAFVTPLDLPDENMPARFRDPWRHLRRLLPI